MRSIFIYVMTTLLYALSANAQQNHDLNLDNSSGRTMSEYFRTLRSKSFIGLGIGYQQVSLLNATFFDNVKNAAIKNKGGYAISLFYNITPVMVDFAYFRSSFEVNSVSFYSDYPKIATGLQGFDAYLSYAPLLPDYGKISEIITPYIGLGYQSAKVFVKDDGESDSDKKTIASYGVSSPVWKGGIRLNLGAFFIKGEYKQSLGVSKPKAMSLISISAGGLF